MKKEEINKNIKNTYKKEGKKYKKTSNEDKIQGRN